MKTFEEFVNEGDENERVSWIVNHGNGEAPRFNPGEEKRLVRNSLR